jgi:hypothetical protein
MPKRIAAELARLKNQRLRESLRYASLEFDVLLAKDRDVRQVMHQRKVETYLLSVVCD